MKNETRYIVTDVVSIPVYRFGGKGEAYKFVTKPGWGLMDWYSATNNYAVPVNRDKSDKTQVLYCDSDCYADMYSKSGCDFFILDEEYQPKDFPKQADVDAIVISDSDGFYIWAKNINDIKFFVTYDKNGLIDNYRIGNWDDAPCEDETEIRFEDLQSEKEHDETNRADIVGALEYARKQEAETAVTVEVTSPITTTATVSDCTPIEDAAEITAIEPIPTTCGGNAINSNSALKAPANATHDAETTDAAQHMANVNMPGLSGSRGNNTIRAG